MPCIHIQFLFNIINKENNFFIQLITIVLGIGLITSSDTSISSKNQTRNFNRSNMDLHY